MRFLVRYGVVQVELPCNEDLYNSSGRLSDHMKCMRGTANLVSESMRRGEATVAGGSLPARF